MTQGRKDVFLILSLQTVGALGLPGDPHYGRHNEVKLPLSGGHEANRKSACFGRLPLPPLPLQGIVPPTFKEGVAILVHLL